MRAHADRVWVFGGAAGVVALLALGWLALISPTNSRADDLRQQADTAQIQLITLQKRIATLQEQQAHVADYQAALTRNRQALPAGPAIPDLLRQLQAAGDAAGVSVSGVTVGKPAPVPGPGLTVYALPVTVNATGHIDHFGGFLDQLQTVQPRAVLIQSASLTADAEGGKDDTALTVTMKAYEAPGR
jgi:Tfp pilus assembly protein PilO